MAIKGLGSRLSHPISCYRYKLLRPCKVSNSRALALQLGKVLNWISKSPRGCSPAVSQIPPGSYNCLRRKRAITIILYTVIEGARTAKDDLDGGAKLATDLADLPGNSKTTWCVTARLDTRRSAAGHGRCSHMQVWIVNDCVAEETL